MKLYFKNSLGKKRLINEIKTEEEALKEIKKFCGERKFEIYYIRTWEDNEENTVYDVGSHTEFFILNK